MVSSLARCGQGNCARHNTQSNVANNNQYIINYTTKIAQRANDQNQSYCYCWSNIFWVVNWALSWSYVTFLFLVYSSNRINFDVVDSFSYSSLSFIHVLNVRYQKHQFNFQSELYGWSLKLTHKQDVKPVSLKPRVKVQTLEKPSISLSHHQVKHTELSKVTKKSVVSLHPTTTQSKNLWLK